MKIQGDYTLNAPRQRVWDALLDPEILAKTLPGCEELVPVGFNAYDMQMKIAMGMVNGAFAGRVELADQQPPESYTLRLNGRGKIGFVNGVGRFQLAEAGEQTTAVSYEGEVQAGGLIAGVGQRLMDMSAKMMIKRFFTALAAELTA
jgi:carbon monoxide dehydrogenase subunit G